MQKFTLIFLKIAIFLFGPALFAQSTVVDSVVARNELSILETALTRETLSTDFVSVLSGDGPFTVFAPSNDAFAALLSELGVASLDDIDDATLESVLLHHVLSGEVLSTGITEGLVAETLFGEELTFSLVGGASLTDENGRKSNITEVDIQAGNGVIHIIDTVILPNQNDIVDIATGNSDFSILVEALTRPSFGTTYTDLLSSDGDFTVFAPTNAAFGALLTELGVGSLDDIDDATLGAVLEMHVFDSEIRASGLSDGLVAQPLFGEDLEFNVTGGATVTDENGRESNITATDILASNGVVHVIDQVILTNQNDIVDIATTTAGFDSLVVALTQPEFGTTFTDLLSGEGPFTVFAPTNAAFESLLTDLSLGSIAEIDINLLESVLQMHVFDSEIRAGDLSDGLVAQPLFGEDLTFNVTGGATVTDENGREINITGTDVLAKNGVVHVIDQVILTNQNDIVDIATTTAGFDSLVVALTQPEFGTTFTDLLSGEGPFTVFAPTNAAFESLLTDLSLGSIAEIDINLLESVLQMHVFDSEIRAGDLSDGLVAQPLFGEDLTFNVTGGATVTDENGREINITGTDVLAKNGVVHVIDQVILTNQNDIVDIATTTPGFDSLVAALTRPSLTTDFVSVLQGEGPFTVFAPTNDAFAALLDELGATSLADIDDATLEAVLLNHVLDGEVRSGALSDGLTAETLFGDILEFTVTGGPFLTDENGRKSNITSVDILAKNGVVHVIDTVILTNQSTIVDIATGNSDFSILVEALTRPSFGTTYTDLLSSDGDFTVFAPTNAAFGDLLTELGVGSLDDIDDATLSAVLEMHVFDSEIRASGLSDGLVAQPLFGEDLTFNVTGGATVTDENGRESNITATDILASNGVVHVIDQVILTNQSDIVDIATGNSDFSILVEALTRPSFGTTYTDLLSSDGDFTVFAPTNAAFGDLLTELGVGSLDDIDDATLSAVLEMHVFDSEIRASGLSDGLVAQPLFGEDLTFNVTGGATITDPNGREIGITSTDILASNGVVHVVDRVILNELPPATVVDIATGDANFSILVEALTREDLSIDFVSILTGDGPFTVFAPTNAAFADLLTELGVSSLDDIDAATLEAVLQMHVLQGQTLAGDLTEGLSVATLFGEEIVFSLDPSATITDPNGRESNITTTDLLAQNGVVHVIDKVILPDQTPATVVDIATSDENFSILVEALTREDLSIDFVNILTGDGPFTVFAPTNAAFADILSYYGAASLDDISDATLEEILLMHVLEGEVLAGDLQDDQSAATLFGEDITFDLTNGAQIIDQRGRVIDISGTDILARNGVVHVVDQVILPSFPTVVDVALVNPDFSILVDALTRGSLETDFVGTLTGEGPFTVFAPTNDAFAALLTELGLASLDDVSDSVLTETLLNHVLSGEVLAGDLSEGLVAQSLFGDDLTFSLDPSATVTDENSRTSNITVTDITTRNGVVHVIDQVLLPNLLPNNAVEVVQADANFSILETALTRTGLAFDFIGFLVDDTRTVTVFAPTNEAFSALLSELGASSLADIDDATLEAVLKMHLLSGEVLAGDLSDGLEVATLEGESIVFDLSSGAAIVDPNGREIGITATDVLTQNGVVHVVDRVIMPFTQALITSLDGIASEVSVYPNPSSGLVKFGKKVNAVVYDATGSEYTRITNASELLISKPGLYMIQFEDNSGVRVVIE